MGARAGGGVLQEGWGGGGALFVSGWVGGVGGGAGWRVGGVGGGGGRGARLLPRTCLVEGAADKAFRIVDGIGWVGSCLILSALANETSTVVVRERYPRRSGAAPIGVRNYLTVCGPRRAIRSARALLPAAARDW